MEDKIARATKRYDSVTSVPTNLFGSWCAKIFYTLYLKGTFLKSDLTDPGSKRLIPPNWVQRINNVRVLIITAAPAFQVIGEHSSVIVLPCNENLPQGPFDYMDMPGLFSLSMRLGPVGVIACLGDGALVCSHLPPSFYQVYASAPLNAVRFREATAEVFVRRAHLEWTPEPVFIESAHAFHCIINPLQLAVSQIFAKIERNIARYIYARVLQLDQKDITEEDDGRFVFHFPGGHHLV